MVKIIRIVIIINIVIIISNRKNKNNSRRSSSKNKMKPTNPNANTYIEEQGQYLFTFIYHIFQRTHLWDTLT